LIELGWDLLASGGTLCATQRWFAVEEVTDYTGSPEILGAG
jgi:AICAR transformylase/IMP cyclohydrolase PurH